nr:hypothetical protein D-143 - Escherichia coli [Escherichia coli]
MRMVIPLQRGYCKFGRLCESQFLRAYCSAFSITCSMLKVVESNTKASAAGTSGGTGSVTIAVVASLISAKRRSKLTLKPFSCNCSMRRCARSSEDASRKINHWCIREYQRSHVAAIGNQTLVIAQTRVGDAIMLHERVECRDL